MNISFDFTNNDIWNYGKHITFNLPKYRRRFIFNVLLVPILVCSVGYVMNFTIPDYILYGVSLTALYVYVLNTVLKGKVIKMNSKEGGPKGQHILEIDKNGIKEKLHNREENHTWAEITKLVQNKKYLYIHYGNLSAYTIPKRAFDTDAELKLFLSTAMEYFNNTKRQ